MTLSILHISDLHRDPENPISNTVLLDSLERDRDRYVSNEETCIEPPNFIIVSGDIVHGVKYLTSDADSKIRRQYDEALDFLNNISARFVDGDKQRVIVVPGNHDVSDHVFRQSIRPVDVTPEKKKAVVAEIFRPNSDVRWSWEELATYKIVNHELYDMRFSAFSEFYSAFYEGNRSYSIDPTKQFDIVNVPDMGIVVAGFSSCYNNDTLNRQGSIHPECIAQVGTHLRAFSLKSEPIRIAVWHHNVEGQPIKSDYMDPEVVQSLIDSGFSLGFHGHQHKPQFLGVRFRYSLNRKMTIISAGTLCGGAAFRFGRSYNVVEISTQENKGCLHVREMQNDNLQTPIWGPCSMPPTNKSYLDFTFAPPPRLFAESSRTTTALAEAREKYDLGNYGLAAEILKQISTREPLARRLLLDCLIRLDDKSGIVAIFDPPSSPAEAIALMDALWATSERGHLARILKSNFVTASEDPSVLEMRDKYKARLQR